MLRVWWGNEGKFSHISSNMGGIKTVYSKAKRNDDGEEGVYWKNEKVIDEWKIRQLTHKRTGDSPVEFQSNIRGTYSRICRGRMMMKLIENARVQKCVFQTKKLWSILVTIPTFPLMVTIYTFLCKQMVWDMPGHIFSFTKTRRTRLFCSQYFSYSTIPVPMALPSRNGCCWLAGTLEKRR